MKIDFSQVLCNIDGSPLLVPDKMEVRNQDGTLQQAGSTKSATLGYVAIEALMAFNQETKESGESKARSYALAMRVRGAEPVEVTAEDITLLKNKIGENFAPIVVGQAWDMLEQKVIGEA